MHALISVLRRQRQEDHEFNSKTLSQKKKKKTLKKVKMVNLMLHVFCHN
jgi:hypothetical protein